jgi:hypothetical protein
MQASTRTKSSGAIYSSMLYSFILTAAMVLEKKYHSTMAYFYR